LTLWFLIEQDRAASFRLSGERGLTVQKR